MHEARITAEKLAYLIQRAKVKYSHCEWQQLLLFRWLRHGNFPLRSFFRVAYIHVGTFLFSCGRRGVNRCDGFSVGRAIEIQEAKITIAPYRRVAVAVAVVTTNGGTEINAKQSNFSCNLTAIFVSAKHDKKKCKDIPTRFLYVQMIAILFVHLYICTLISALIFSKILFLKQKNALYFSKIVVLKKYNYCR